MEAAAGEFAALGEAVVFLSHFRDLPDPRQPGKVIYPLDEGLDWGDRFPAIVAAVEALAVRTCTVDGEVIACAHDGLADFELLRYRRRDAAVTLVAFDLIELDGSDLRSEPIEQRKSELARLLAGCRRGVVLNAVFAEPGAVVFKYACALGCEGIVSKRRRSRYAAGRSDAWIKVKNPKAPAVRREFEEDWGRSR